MDKLEEHIRQNREDMDRYSPSSGIWKKILVEIYRRKAPVRHWLSIAAMLIVVLAAALVFIRPGYLRSGDGMSENTDSSGEQENPQLKETEIYYNNLMNSLYREATQLLTANPEIQKELITDISHLDSICLEIKKDFKDNVANQEVVEALIQNYRIKIRLLEDMLNILMGDEIIPEKNKSNEL